MSSSNFVGDSASSPIIEDYDVFLSFRGEDTRFGFVSHLYKALVDRDIKTFRDDKKLDKGKEISPELLTAIERSRFFIIVLSENYASSRWCLAELDHILDCSNRRRTTETVLPVFYNIDPSMVRKQTGSFEVAFRRHEIDHLEGSSDPKVERWRDALRKTANLSGFDTRNRYEADVVKEIVAKIYDKLNYQLLGVDEHLIGMEDHVNEIRSKLLLGSGGVRFIGIFGMGGIGKTTVAKVIYNKIYHQFECCSYIKEVRKSHTDLSSPQRQLSLDIIKEDDLRIHNTDRGISILKSGLGNKRVLLVLDDVDHLSQLEALAGHKNWFGEGSRIIITSRDERLLIQIGVDERYAMRLLDRYQSIQLFSLKAFEQERPPDDYYWKLSHQVVSYANGLPLALKVLGSDFYKLSTDEWKGKLAGMRRDPPKDIMDVLKISYDGLGEQDKKIFLYVACLLKEKKTTFATDVLNSCDLNPNIGLSVLVQKSLIKKSVYLEMHDLVEEMGRLIIHQESPDDPAERRWLWDEEDIYDVLTTNTNFPGLTSIKLSDCEYLTGIPDLSGSPNLATFTLYRCTQLVEVHPSIGGLRKLTRLEFRDCSSLKSIPYSLGLKSLEYFNMSGCSKLEKCPQFQDDMKRLESLSLSFSGIKELCSSIGNLTALHTLDIGGCKNLTIVPDSICKLTALTALRALNLPAIHSLHSLNLDHCDLSEIPKEFGCWFTRLEYLNLRGNNFVNLPASFSQLSRINDLYLDGCPRLEELPELPSSRIRVYARNCPSLKRLTPTLAKSESSDSIHGDFFLDVTKLLHMHSRKSHRVDFWLSANNVTEFFKFSHQSIGPSAFFCIPLPCNLAKLEGFAHCVVTELRGDWGGARTTIKKNLGYTSFDSLGREEGITRLNILFKSDDYIYQIVKCGVHLVYKEDDDAELSQSNCCIEIEDHVSTELSLKERINLVENEVLPNGQENMSAKRNHPNNGDQFKENLSLLILVVLFTFSIC